MNLILWVGVVHQLFASADGYHDGRSTFYDEDLQSLKNHNKGAVFQSLDQLFSGAHGPIGFKPAILTMTDWCDHKGAEVQYADINGDGRADMLCDDKQGRHWHRLYVGGPNTIEFGPTKMSASGFCSRPTGVTHYADINGDASADMLCDDEKGRHSLRLADKNGVFMTRSELFHGWCKGSTFNQMPTSFADIDGDGKLDMLCDQPNGAHRFRKAKSGGQFEKETVVLSGVCAGAESKVHWADINGDKRADLCCESATGKWLVYLSDKQEDYGHFLEPVEYAPAFCRSSSCSTHYVDLNADGRVDVACACTNGTATYKLTLQHGADQDSAVVFATHMCSHAGARAQFADVNGDGKADFLCDDDEGRHWVALATAWTQSPTRLGHTISPLSPAPLAPPTPYPMSVAPTPSTDPPTPAPSHTPTDEPTFAPTHTPKESAAHNAERKVERAIKDELGARSAMPTPFPTAAPRAPQSSDGGSWPTDRPTVSPSHTPTDRPSEFPSLTPTDATDATMHRDGRSRGAATRAPLRDSDDGFEMRTDAPTHSPSHTPTFRPTAFPSQTPTDPVPVSLLASKVAGKEETEADYEREGPWKKESLRWFANFK